MTAGKNEGFVEWFYTDLAEREVSHVLDMFLEGGHERQIGVLHFDGGSVVIEGQRRRKRWSRLGL